MADREVAQMMEDLIAEIDALHVKSVDFTGKPICEHCMELCHSRSGLQCDSPDGAWPCETVKIVERYRTEEEIV